MPVNRSAQSVWVQSPFVFLIVFERYGLRWLEVRQLSVRPKTNVMVDKCSFYELLVFRCIVQEVHRVGNAAIHVITVAVKVVTNLLLVAFEQLFDPRSLCFNDYF